MQSFASANPTKSRWKAETAANNFVRAPRFIQAAGQVISRSSFKPSSTLDAMHKISTFCWKMWAFTAKFAYLRNAAALCPGRGGLDGGNVFGDAVICLHRGNPWRLVWHPCHQAGLCG